jgi:hypothetical protein
VTKTVACVLVFAAIACGKAATVTPDSAAADANAIDAPGADAFQPFDGWIYGHSYFELYRIDPRSLAVIDIGAFQWPTGMDSEMMTDIAVDQDDHLTGVSFDGVFSIDPMNAKTTYLAPLTREFNGLSYVPATELGQTGPDTLVGTTLDGSIWSIDPTSGASTQIGQFGNGLISSGDLVSIKGFGTIATVNMADPDAIDYLARVDFTNGGAATVIGSTGMYDIWGLGFWGGKVYGFVATNEVVGLDLVSGAATTIEKGPMNWCGAGVTTIAPLIP